jgi:hypothetical protein
VLVAGIDEHRLGIVRPVLIPQPHDRRVDARQAAIAWLGERVHLDHRTIPFVVADVADPEASIRPCEVLPVLVRGTIHVDLRHELAGRLERVHRSVVARVLLDPQDAVHPVANDHAGDLVERGVHDRPSHGTFDDRRTGRLGGPRRYGARLSVDRSLRARDE